MGAAETISPLALTAVVERVRVGSSVCLFRSDNRATALLGAEAAATCDSILHERTHCRSGDPAAAALHDTLQCAGFLEAAPALRRAAVGASAPRAFSSQPAAIVTLNGRSVAVRCSEPGLGVLLSAVLAPLRTADATRGFNRRSGRGTRPDSHERLELSGLVPRPDLRLRPDGICDSPADASRVSADIEVRSSNGAFGVWRDGVRIAGGLDLAEARRVALQSVLIALMPEQRLAAILHASTVAVDGLGVLLAGATGSGKSTLSMALVAAGCAYVADDFTPLLAPGDALGAFPVAASIKSGSFSAVARDFPVLEMCDVHRAGERRVKYLDLSGRALAGATCAPSALVFPRYTAGADTRAERLTPEEALTMLLTTGSEIVGDPRSIAPLATLVNETPAWRLVFSDTSAATRHVLSAMLSQ